MNKLMLVCGAALALVGTAQAGAFQDRWFYLSGTPFSDEGLARIARHVKTASVAGFNGMLWAGGLENCDQWDDERKARVKEVKALCDRHGIEIIPLVWSIGYGTMLGRDPNLVAAQPVEDVPYVVDRDAVWARPAPPATPLVANGDFEATGKRLLPAWRFWDQEGVITFRDTAVRHGGAASVRLEPSYEKNLHGHARLCTEVALRPHHFYKLRAWVRTEGLAVKAGQEGFALKARLGETDRWVSARPQLEPTQDWTRVELAFNSGESAKALVYLGMWGGSGGKFWVDDVDLAEPGLSVFLQRAGTPTVVKDAASGRVYRDGIDYKLPKVYSLWSAQKRDGESFRILPGSAIKPGARLLVSAYTPSFGTPHQLSTCMSEPRLYTYFDSSAQAIWDLLKPRKWFLSQDEIRAGGTCAACRARGVDMAHQLADCLAKQRASIKRVSPEADIYVWSDMLDPAHNAHDNYYACKGTFAGVWDLIPKDLIISCWYYEKRDTSMPFFAARGFRTQAAAYYDADTLDTSRDWLATCRRTKGCTGIMYTTWRDKYDLLKPFGEMLKE